MSKFTEQQLKQRDAKRDVAAELVHAARELQGGGWARKTTIETLPDGRVRRKVVARSGKVEKNEVISGERVALVTARARAGLSQAGFAAALGVSKRTLEGWEHGRVTPTGAARALVRLVAAYPATVKQLAKLHGVR